MIDTYRYWMAESMPPPQMVLLLYDRALTLLGEAEAALEHHRAEQANRCLLQTQRILEELDCVLDPQRGGEIARNLTQLYDFLQRTLVEANLHKQSGPVRATRAIVADLREAWAQVAQAPRSAG